MADIIYAKATGQRTSNQVWAGCKSAIPGDHPDVEVGFLDDFMHDSDGKWVETQATSGTVVQGDYEYGMATFDAGATTADQGMQRQLEGEMFLPAAGRTIYFEARVKPTNIANQFFVGLAVEDTSVFAAGENSTANHIGFEMGTTSIAADATQWGFYAEKAGTRNAAQSILTGALTSAAWVTLGFKVVGLNTVYVYVNNALIDSTTLTSTEIPVTEMTPTIVCQAEGTTQPTLDVDFVKVIQTV
jgi:hypothetical protein